MGDTRFDAPYRALRAAPDAARATAALEDDEVIQALAAASRERDPYFANVLATQAMNRMRRARVVFEHIGEGVFVVGAEGEVRAMNPAARRMLGWRRADLAETPPHTVLHPPGAATCAICRALETRAPESCEAERIARRSAPPLPVSCVVTPLLQEGSLDGLVVAFRDETERAAWNALTSAFYHLHDELGLGLVITEGARLHYANDAFRAMLGRSLDELRAMETLLDLVAPEDRERMQVAMIWAGHAFPPRTARARLLTRAGDPIPVDVYVTVAADEPGAPPRYVCLVQPA
ncbi:MAG: hypothetical protein QOE90_3659 [Thermoplasmata archaeon]|jgi:PAS domain S-box-containing protein|nr:hypothetical protein [Thermoplasmata archaeon]